MGQVVGNPGQGHSWQVQERLQGQVAKDPANSETIGVLGPGSSLGHMALKMATMTDTSGFGGRDWPRLAATLQVTRQGHHSTLPASRWAFPGPGLTDGGIVIFKRDS